MKKLFRNYLFLLIPVLTVLAVSCKDDEEPILAPQITSVSPNEGLPGTPVTITGTNLANATVTFGNEAATTSTNTATTITTTVPTNVTPGATQITVTTAGGSDSETFTVLETDPGQDEATITAVTPATGGPGTEVTITGTNFTGATALAIGETNVAAEDFEIDETGENITFTIPEDAEEGDYTGTITVTTPAGVTTSADDVTFTFTPDGTGEQATITSVSPTTVGPGSQVTVTGTNLTGITGLRIGEDTELTEEDFEVDEAGENITFTVPEDATEGYTGPFTITTAEGDEIAGPEDVTLTFNMNTPVVTEVDPENMTGTVGDVVTLTGRNFTDAEVFFVGADGTEVQATLEETSTTETLVFTVPEGAQTGPITIRTTVDGEEFETQTGEFTIGESQGASITGISEARGIPGYTLNLTGENLTAVTGVTVGGEEADFEEQEDGTLNVTIPEGVQPGENVEIVVTTAAGESEPFTDFAVDDPAMYPTVTAVESEDPDAEEMTGAPGDVITITGTNLAGAEVYFGDVQAEVDPTSTTETLVFTIPEDAATGPIIIRTADGYIYTETFNVVADNGGGDAGSQYFTGSEPGNIDFAIYEDELAENFQLWGWDMGDQSAENTENAQSGTNAIYAPYAAEWGGFQIGIDETFDLTGYETLVISIYGGEGAGDVQLWIKSMTDGTATDHTQIPLRVEEGEYRTYEIPLSDLGNPPNIRELVLQDMGTAGNEIYIDNIGLR